MTLKIGAIAGLVGGGLLLAVLACGSDKATVTPAGGPPPTPDAQTTLTALPQDADFVSPTPTAVPARDRMAALDFASGQRQVSQKWDAFHADFDTWREGLSACNANSVRSSLQGFAARFAGVTRAARALPRQRPVRGLANTLIQAAEQEEEALRLLRDTWQPREAAALPAAPDSGRADDSNDSNTSSPAAAISPFGRVDIARSASSRLRQEVADALSDRQERTTPESLDRIGEFAAIFNATDAAWDWFHRDYDSLRRAEGGLTPGEIADRLGLLIDQLRGIAVAIQQAPTTVTTRGVAYALAQAAEKEDLALRRLRDALQREEQTGSEGPAEAPALPADNGEFEGEVPTSETQDAGGAGAVTFTPADFGPFDAQLVASNAVRLQARHDLEDILDDISPGTVAIVKEFTGQYQLLLKEWDEFHEDYDEWRRNEGGCDRAKAVDALGRFTVAFSGIATDVRGLSTATVLRPLGEILVEAAEREERALRGLSDTWRPYDPAVFAEWDRERSTAGRLRRQAAVGAQELLERFGISPDELN